jgi:hypothetical protein
MTVVSAVNAGAGDGSVRYAWAETNGTVFVGRDYGNLDDTSFTVTGSNALPGASVGLAVTKPGGLSLFWTDAKGDVWSAYDDPGNPGGSGIAFDLVRGAGAPPGSPVTAVSTGPGEVTALWTRADGSIWQEWFIGGAWNGPVKLYGPGLCGAIAANPGQALGAASTSPGEISVYWTGQDSTGQTAIQMGQWDPASPSPKCSATAWTNALTIADPSVSHKRPTATMNTMVSAVNNQSDREATVLWAGPAEEVLQVWYSGGTTGTWSNVLGVVAHGTPFGPVP